MSRYPEGVMERAQDIQALAKELSNGPGGIPFESAATIASTSYLIDAINLHAQQLFDSSKNICGCIDNIPE